MADSIEHVISYWVIFREFQSPALGGFAVVAHWLPYLLFSMHAGALADRFDPRRVIQLGMLLFMIVSLAWGVLFATQALQMWHAMVLLVLHGIAGVLWSPASQVLLHHIVPAERLQSGPVQQTFEKISPVADFPALEARIRAFWRERNVFHRSLEQRRGGPRFVFYEGPPTANGLPHNGHALTRVIKDVFPRYRAMRGFDVPRKAGWDTHGLPVEIEVEKELRIRGRAAILEYGVEPFVRRCLESVFRYTEEWRSFTEKLGFWIDLDDAYVTYHESYVESVWWALARLRERGLLYQGHKVVWWWAQGGTVLSAAEVGEGYRTVDDPSVYVRLPLRDEPGTSLLVWTTTPWTLPSNTFAAVRPDLDYAVLRDRDQRLVVAAPLVDEIARKAGRELPVEATLRGEALVGRRYEPPFDWLWTSSTRPPRKPRPSFGTQIRPRENGTHTPLPGAPASSTAMRQISSRRCSSTPASKLATRSLTMLPIPHSRKWATNSTTQPSRAWKSAPR